jgi:HAD superfamily hydrolase (TIGR01509 family)
MGLRENTVRTVPIETLFLDAGGVLVFPNWTRVSDSLAKHGVQAAPETLAVAELRAKRRLDLGDTIRATDDSQRGWIYFNLTLEEAGIPLTADTDAALSELREYHGTENLWESVPDNVVPTLDALRSLGPKLVVVSNANGRLRHLFSRLGLADRVDVLFDSFEEGVEKPDPRLFQIALERSGGRPATTVHVGDLYHVDVVGARAAGLQAVLLDAGGLYDGYDCPRIRAFSELPALLAAGIRAM